MVEDFGSTFHPILCMQLACTILDEMMQHCRDNIIGLFSGQYAYKYKTLESTVYLKIREHRVRTSYKTVSQSYCACSNMHGRQIYKYRPII